MKSTFHRSMLLLVVIAVLIAACTPAATPTAAPQPTAAPVATKAPEPTAAPVATKAPEPTAAPAAKPLRVAVIMPSPITDAAFSQSMFEALKSIQTEMGGEAAMELAYSEGMFNVPDAAAAVRDYANKGFDLVIAHGSQYGSSLAQIAPDFPETSFAWGTSLDTFQSQGINNVFAYQAQAEQGGYVLGTIAALMSKSGVLGVSGPVEAGDAKLYVDGFKAGALAAKPIRKGECILYRFVL